MADKTVTISRRQYEKLLADSRAIRKIKALNDTCSLNGMVPCDELDAILDGE